MWRAVAVALLAAASPCAAKTPLALHAVVAAELVLPTERYDHAILGDGVEWGGLKLTVDTCPPCADRRLHSLTVRLPKNRVFEDIDARVKDVTGDGLPEVIVVETDLQRGAALAVYDAYGHRVATSFIGKRHRWLAPAGVGDFDGDGRIEIAYVDRPHLKRELVFVRLEDDQLREISRIPNLTNHQIGDDFITGGVRNCGQGDELVLASGDWTQAMVVTMDGARAAGAVDRIPALVDCRD